MNALRLPVFLAGWLTLAAAGAAASSSTTVEHWLRQLSLEQKVGQLLMVGFGGTKMEPELQRLLSELHVGAVALYSRNIVSTGQVRRLVADIERQFAGSVPPLVAVDQEGGNVVRLKQDVMVLPGAMALGATGDEALAFLCGQAMGIDLRQLGFTMNLAPVLDINSNPRNPVINVRALGDDPQLVAELGVYLMLGQQLAGVATVAKHFPGHGATAADSHYHLPVIEHDREQLLARDALPFRRAMAVGLDAVMVAHVRVPRVDPSQTPASLSAPVIDGILRRELGYDGVVITDDLEMHAVADRYGVGEAALMAIAAGSDMIMVIWTPRRKREVFASLLQAVRQGRLSRERLDASVRRILQLKARRGLFGPDRPRPGPLPNRWHDLLAQTVARRAVTLVRNQGNVVPLEPEQQLLVASSHGVFLEAMRRRFPRSDTVLLRSAPTRGQLGKRLEQLLRASSGARAVVVAVTNKYQAWLVQQLYHRSKVPVVVVSLGSPYLLRHFPGVAAYLCTYSYRPRAQRAAAAALAGEMAITGRLPVAISSHYPRGHGLQLPRRRPPP